MRKGVGETWAVFHEMDSSRDDGMRLSGKGDSDRASFGEEDIIKMVARGFGCHRNQQGSIA